MTASPKEKKRGLSLRMMIILAFIIGLIFAVLLLLSMYQVAEQYTEMENATIDYVDTQTNAGIIQDAVSDLNEFARNFVITGNTEEVIKYFNEVQVQQSQEAALVQIESKLTDENLIKQLHTAILLSDQMRDTQYYAMRLAIEGYGYSLAKYPEGLRTQELTEEDLALTGEEQLSEAREMLFSKEYTLMKGQVDIRLDLCKDELLETMQSRHQESSDDLQRLLSTQRLYIIILVLLLLIVLIFVLAMVVYPISKMISGIRQEVHILPSGSSEMVFLADTYNRMYGKMEAANTQLSYEASHDALTGLYNRAYYEELRGRNLEQNVALLIVDVDLFKGINDTWGHAIGDKVLIRVAKILSEAFREADRVCRIGGDEFAVVMMGVNSSMKDMILRKFETVSEVLKEQEDDIPPVTISVGGTFSDQLKEGESLFKNADRALYKIKEKGRNGCGFYPEERPIDKKEN